MKKLLSVIIFILLFSCFMKVDAAYIYEGEKIPNIYFYKHREDTADITYEYHNFHMQATVFRRSTDNNYVYCIQSWEELTGASEGDYYEIDSKKGIAPNLTNEQAERIKLLGYFGYGYKDDEYDHSDIKWYAITQYLIWCVEAPEIEHYFVSSITSTTPINPYEKEIAELNKMVDSINLSDRTVNLGNLAYGIEKQIKVEGDINDYTVIMGGPITFKKDFTNNTFLVRPTTGDYNGAYLKLTRNYRRISTTPIYYVSDKYQNAMAIGLVKEGTVVYKMNTVCSAVAFNAYEGDDKSKPLTNVRVGVYADEDIYLYGELKNKKGEEVDSYNLDSNGNTIFVCLPPGKFYFKMKSDISEYYDDNQTTNFTINSNEKITVNHYYHHQKLKIDFQKKVSIPIAKDESITYDYIGKNGITFGLYNELDEKIDESESNDDGHVIFSLDIPYGNYYLKEINSLPNYELNNEIYNFSFQRNGNNEYQIIGEDITFINNIKMGTFTITKKDDKDILLNDVIFSILNENNEVVFKGKTKDGVLSTALPYGNYFIKEESTTPLHILSNDLIPITIDSETLDITIINESIKSEEIIDLLDNDEILEDISGSTMKNLYFPNTSYDPIKVSVGNTSFNNYLDYFYLLFIFLGVIYIIYEEKNNY